jgi:hypothetical protein
MPTIIRNRELFEKIAARIEQDERKHYQSDWSNPKIVEGKEADVVVGDIFVDCEHETPNYCNTAFCVAGHAVIEGCKAKLKLSIGRSMWSDSGFQIDRNWFFKNGVELNTNRVPYEARVLLGLTQDESGILFGSDWEPRASMTVPEALRALGAGASIESVTDEDYLEDLDNHGSWGHYASWKAYLQENS